jgi:hypothetical protein
MCRPTGTLVKRKTPSALVLVATGVCADKSLTVTPGMVNFDSLSVIMPFIVCVKVGGVCCAHAGQAKLSSLKIVKKVINRFIIVKFPLKHASEGLPLCLSKKNSFNKDLRFFHNGYGIKCLIIS